MTDAGETRHASWLVVDADCGEVVGGPYTSEDFAHDTRDGMDEPWRYRVELSSPVEHHAITDPDDGVAFCAYDNEVWPCRGYRESARPKHRIVGGRPDGT